MFTVPSVLIKISCDMFKVPRKIGLGKEVRSKETNLHKGGNITSVHGKGGQVTLIVHCRPGVLRFQTNYI